MSSLTALVNELSAELESLRQTTDPETWERLREELARLVPTVDGALTDADPRGQIKAFHNLTRVFQRYPTTRGVAPRVTGTALTDPPAEPTPDEPITGLPQEPVRQKLIEIVARMADAPSGDTPLPPKRQEIER